MQDLRREEAAQSLLRSGAELVGPAHHGTWALHRTSYSCSHDSRSGRLMPFPYTLPTATIASAPSFPRSAHFIDSG